MANANQSTLYRVQNNTTRLSTDLRAKCAINSLLVTFACTDGGTTNKPTTKGGQKFEKENYGSINHFMIFLSYKK